MPRSAKTTRPAEPSSAQCHICGRMIQRKSDMARHMRIHATDKSQLMHHCPICGYENMQKSNVDTHIRTHTKMKSRCCPDCAFSTSDPGSLTRHRKRAHGYVPKQRRPRDLSVPYPYGPHPHSHPPPPPRSMGSESDGIEPDAHEQGHQDQDHDDRHVPRKIRDAPPP